MLKQRTVTTAQRLLYRHREALDIRISKRRANNNNMADDACIFCIVPLVLLGMPIPAAALSKAWVCGRSLAGVAGSNPPGILNVCLLVVLTIILVEFSASC